MTFGVAAGVISGDARSERTMAEARQKEMKVNITVVATKTFMAGLAALN